MKKALLKKRIALGISSCMALGTVLVSSMDVRADFAEPAVGMNEVADSIENQADFAGVTGDASLEGGLGGFDGSSQEIQTESEAEEDALETRPSGEDSNDGQETQSPDEEVNNVLVDVEPEDTDAGQQEVEALADVADDTWTTVVSREYEYPIDEFDYYVGADGTVYYLKDDWGENVCLYNHQYQISDWISDGFEYNVRSARLVRYEDMFYVVYVKEKVYSKEPVELVLAGWKDGQWKKYTVFKGNPQGFDVVSNSDGLYIAYSDGSKLNVCKYMSQDRVERSVVGEATECAGGIFFTAEDGRVSVMYQAGGGGRLHVKQYDNGTWHLAGAQDSIPAYGNGGIVKLHNGKVYLLGNMEYGSDRDDYLYVYDLSSADGSWRKVTEEPYASECTRLEGRDICFQGDVPYVIYYGQWQTDENSIVWYGRLFTKKLDGGKWDLVGALKEYGYSSHFKGGFYNGKLYVAFCHRINFAVSVVVNEKNSSLPSCVKDGWIYEDGQSRLYHNGSRAHGWTYENGQKKYYYDDGVKATGERYIDGHYYCFWGDGTMMASREMINNNNEWVFYDENGHRASGWVDGAYGRSYYDPGTGARAKGVRQVDGKYYCFTDDGVMRTGFIMIDGKLYYFDSKTGARADFAEKEVVLENNWYWFDADGSIAYSKDVFQRSNGGKWVRYDHEGRMVKGWFWTPEGTYYFDPITGAMAKGVTNIDGVYYYFRKDTGIQANYTYEEVALDGDWYWFDGVGMVAVSKDVFQTSNGGKWVRYDEEGRMVKGWDDTPQGKYYFDPITGAMAKGVKQIDGKYYYFYNMTGIRAEYQNEEVPIDGYWRWFDADGTVAVSKDVYQWSSGGKWVRYDASGGMVKGWDHTFWGSYYFDLTTGAMAKGLSYIDGRWYYFDEGTGILRW